jgi:methylmalonyl-CoA mutase N-terminal domain/subunit
VGRVGVPISTIQDMNILFDDISLNEVSTSMTINATAPILFALYIVAAENQGISSNKLMGTIQNDILKEYIARGTYIFPPEPSMRLVTDLLEFASIHTPKWNPISISGYHIREAGSTASQELAFTISNGITYVSHALKKNEILLAKVSGSNPLFIAWDTYVIPFEIVKASSWEAVEPASLI